MLAPGTRLGPYEVTSVLGRGGMATLYLARWSGPAGFERRVAVKVLHPEVARDGEFVNMFLDEARLSACIQHPNVVHVEGLGEHGGRHYIVMEYIEGVTLADVLHDHVSRRERIPVPIIVALMARAAEGLHAAHESSDESGRALGIIHRDVSPQNVLIARSGHVKVIDFGVAKARHRLAQTMAGSVKGKLAYMAPEQLSGRALDRRLDVFSLGVLTWEMLTLQRLFLAHNDLETIARIREARVEPPSRHRTDLPPRLDDVVLTMLARDLEERFATTAAARAAMLTTCPEALSVDAAALGELVRRTPRGAVPPLPEETEQEEVTVVQRPAAARDRRR